MHHPIWAPVWDTTLTLLEDTLAEVEVLSGGRNLARAGTATQSSVNWGGTAERAIDGLAGRLGLADRFFGGSADRGHDHALSAAGLTVERLRATPEGVVVAGSVAAAIAVMILYYLGQRFVVQGLAAGAVKG